MSVELQDSDDPVELVAASHSALARVSEGYGELEKVLEDCADSLRKIRTNSWSGSSADAFGATCARMTRHWMHLAGTYDQIRGANARYTEALGWARGQAREAVALWEGDQSTRRQGRRVETRDDEQLRQDRVRAREMLDDARSALGREGDQAAVAIDRANAAGEATGSIAPRVVFLPPEHTTIVSAPTQSGSESEVGDDGWRPLTPPPARIF